MVRVSQRGKYPQGGACFALSAARKSCLGAFFSSFPSSLALVALRFAACSKWFPTQLSKKFGVSSSSV